MHILTGETRSVNDGFVLHLQRLTNVKKRHTTLTKLWLERNALKESRWYNNNIKRSSMFFFQSRSYMKGTNFKQHNNNTNCKRCLILERNWNPYKAETAITEQNI